MTNFAHGGHIKQLAASAKRPPGDILDFSANINPLGPPGWVAELVRSRLDEIRHYPDPDCTALIAAIAGRYGVDHEEVIVGNGSTEILYLLPRVLPHKKALIPVPSYVDYAHVARLFGLFVMSPVLAKEKAFAPDLDAIGAFLDENATVFLGQPNNPTGMLFDAAHLRGIARQYPGVTFIVDEAFADFVEDMDSMTRKRPPNVVVLLSLTKIFAIPGIRLGCAVADREIVRPLKALLPPWSVNTIAQLIGEAALQDGDYLAESRRYVTARRAELTRGLRATGCFTVYPGAANFLLVKCNRAGMGASLIADRLLAGGIAVRRCHNFEGLDDRFLRIAVRTTEENTVLLSSLEKILSDGPL